jgi:type IV pilus assembly protein PilA
MLHLLRARIDRGDEEGFTLIELMVVVLIIAILLAIAIPTFLGARSKAQDRAAESNLRNALTAEKTYYVDNEAYTDNTSSNLTNIEPSLTYAAAAGPSVVNTVYVESANATDVYLASKSASGTCFWIHDSTTTGTTYATDSACGSGTPSTFTAHW